MRSQRFMGILLSALLLFAMLSSMAFAIGPVPPPPLRSIDIIVGSTIYYHWNYICGGPSYESVLVPQGRIFIIRHEMEWSETAPGKYGVTIYWDCPENRVEENFTLVDASAYFDNGDTIEATVWRGEAMAPDNENCWRYVITVYNTVADPRNGIFYVDIAMSASGVGGIPHIVTDNHPILYSMIAGITIIENTLVSYNEMPPIKISVLSAPAVEMGISPLCQEGVPGGALEYAITITNWGVLADYSLTVSDNAGWNPTLSENLLENVGPGENRVITLSVTIPENATSFTEDNIIVTATSVENALVSASASCVAQVQGKVKFRLATLFKVSLDADLCLGSGSKLVVKFYTYTNAYRGENVVWSGATPDNLSFSKIVPHPEGWVVENVGLDLTYDDTENVISTLGNFTVRKGDLERRFLEIPFYWSQADPAGKLELEAEFMWIPFCWSGAPD